jgi:hypothetical protein
MKQAAGEGGEMTSSKPGDSRAPSAGERQLWLLDHLQTDKERYHVYPVLRGTTSG